MEHVRYSELENTYKKVLDLYNNNVDGTLCKIEETMPNVTLINGYSGALLVYSLIKNVFINDNVKLLI